MARQQRTPLMRQYHQIKERYPDTILLFRLGDFYETFEEDAGITARVCGITLTKRGNGTEEETPLAGFPWHQLDSYLPKLVRAGYRVAVCDQLEDPKLARGIVRRDVVEVVTPGAAMNERLLDAGRNNFLLAVIEERGRVGVAFCDVSTGEFQATEVAEGELPDVLEAIAPAEILVSRAQRDRFAFDRLASQPCITKLEEWIVEYDFAFDRLREHFSTASLRGFGFDTDRLAVTAAGAVLHYLTETQRNKLGHIRKISHYAWGDYLPLDRATRRNLEILFAGSDGARHGSLLDVIDRTVTPMGGRLLKRWIVSPLRSRDAIERRLEAVETLLREVSIAVELQKELRTMGDIERVVGRVATGRATPRDLGAMRAALERVPRVRELLERCGIRSLVALAGAMAPLPELYTMLCNSIADEPPAALADGGAIRAGWAPELDELREMRAGGRSYLDALQERERTRTGIGSLKVGFNNVFGYYLEITNAHRDRVPADYIRKQTLTNAERYITPELKEYEEKILHAEEKIAVLERELFGEVQARAAESGEPLQRTAQAIASLDCLLGFAQTAREGNYCRPVVEESTRLEIEGGRHPVVETLLPPGERYVPNDTWLNGEAEQIAIITGPNMAGKSSLLRQVGLIVLLAQIGSFVPARRAVVGIVDRIFTRVGAQDNLTAGESTFLVEMHEAATILNNATDRSLILLDEVGRGTSTFDGISIAWAMTEYIHERIGARTLFATHYHELNALAERYPRVRNFKVEVREHGDQVIFLRTLAPGGADHSYGIHVARMAGLPEEVTSRAEEIMARLEQNAEHRTPELEQITKNSPGTSVTIHRDVGFSDVSLQEEEGLEGEKSVVSSLFDASVVEAHSLPHPSAEPPLRMFVPGNPVDESLRNELRALDINSLTPIEALMVLDRLRRLIEESPQSEF